jgi:hypothetical protein
LASGGSWSWITVSRQEVPTGSISHVTASCPGPWPRHSNRATAASWAVGDDFDAIVEDLRAKGVTFERYDDLPDTKREGAVHIAGEFRAVWFKDPDGNILNVINESM